MSVHSMVAINQIAMTAEQWNAAHPIGTPVRYWPILPPIASAPPVDTRTRSEAWTLGHGDAVVAVEGKTGSTVDGRPFILLGLSAEKARKR